MNTKKFTILHSNDMHGDFLAEVRGEEGRLIGGLSLLSGYINQVRKQEQNTLFVIAGDMVQGSMIDSEYKGVSTMEIMNYLAPDVATLGNHELDYGLAHLLFLEKMANFPIVNANLYIRQHHRRLMHPYHIIEMDGFEILFIGILTESVLNKLAMDEIGAFISLEDAASEVGRICNAYKDQDIDLTVLLTHIGFDSDKELAALLDPQWGVDMMIGGHSHTILEQPERINNILIAQAGTGTDQIGRFDIVVDDDTNSIVEWKWQLVTVDSNLAEPDKDLAAFIDSYKTEVDRKYNTMICRLAERLTHPKREVETALGNLVADMFAERSGVDVVFLGSGSLRGTELGPVVTLGNLRTIYAYDGPLYKCTVSGATLRHMFARFMHPDNRRSEGECYQVNRGVKAVYNNATTTLESLTINDEPVDDSRRYTICLQDYHYTNGERIFELPAGTFDALVKHSVVTTSGRDVLQEYLGNSQNLTAAVEGRLEYR
jgi:5'-nucleotidase